MTSTGWADRAARRLEVGAYYTDPVAWLDRYIDWEGTDGLAPYQSEIIADTPRRKRIAVRGPHGLGKSAIAALLVIWFAITRTTAATDWKVLTTASAWRHLTIYLWPEIHKWLRRVRWDELGIQAPRARIDLLDLRLKLEHGAASAIASDDAVNLEGAHADSILYVFDEAKAIPPPTWDAAEGALAADAGDGSIPEAFALAISTPGAPQGRFYDIHTRKPGLEDWHTRHVTLKEATDAGRISAKWAEQRKRQWGADSALYRNRVLGEFHAADEDAVIPLQWIEEANLRHEEWERQDRPALTGRRFLGVDVARSGADKTALARRHGPGILDIERKRYADTMATVAYVTALLKEDETAVVDSIGIGAGVVDRLRELHLPAKPYTGSAGTSVRDRSGEFGFTNVRSAAYWNLRELLDPSAGSELLLPDDDQLTADLCAPRWEVTSGVPPRIKVEAKDVVNARLGRSTDTGDAVAMAFWGDRLAQAVEVAFPQGPRTPQVRTREQMRGLAPVIERGRDLAARVLSPLQGDSRNFGHR